MDSRAVGMATPRIVFILRDGANLLGALAVSCQDGSNGARSTAFVHGLLRPALQVLARELAHQHSVCDLRKNLTSRDGDLALLLEASGAAYEQRQRQPGTAARELRRHPGLRGRRTADPERKIALSCAAEELASRRRRRDPGEDPETFVDLGAGPAPHAGVEQDAAEQSAGRVALQNPGMSDPARRAGRRGRADSVQAGRTCGVRCPPGSYRRAARPSHRLRRPERV